ncbi:DUF2971 domain-containing protein [Photobacterium leiognathi]|uniref:DUF2971 domain-containing protein n=1 Tax=Photobacterium leiognathi TaxID=553611 RepID=UPI002980DA6C|nr:DUF2971 domain-containing protein [Photobacterium leiognathi]
MNNEFCKYTKFSTNIINSILCNNIWHAEVSTLNDPFELNFRFKKNMPSNINDLTALFERNNYFTLDVNKEKEKEAFIRIFLNEGLEGILNVSNKIIEAAENNFIKQVGKRKPFICSMSIYDDEPLMWSHYSDGMKGICIVYNADVLHDSGLELKKVNYDEKIHEVDFLKTYESYKKLGSKFNAKDLSNIYFSKHKRWEYEGEYRSVLWPEEHELNLSGIQYPLPENAIKRIIYGYRISQSELNTLKKLAKLKKIPLFQASPNYSEFRVIIDK